MGPRIAGRLEQGFTLVELMVALAIGAFIILGATAVFLSTLRSYQVQNGSSEMSDSGRYALQYLARHVRMAGYRDSEWERGVLLDALDVTNGASDSLSVTYESRFGCNLAAAAGVVEITSDFDVVDNTLRCNGRRIIDGVEEMQIFLGEDTDGDSVVNRYVAPGTAGLDMNDVVAVSLNLLMRSEADSLALAAVPHQFAFWNTPETDDGRLRREYSLTVALRNFE
jgi:type IV pilus assembly protein PilW